VKKEEKKQLEVEKRNEATQQSEEKRRKEEARKKEEKKRGREEAPCGEDVHGEVHQVQGEGVLALWRWT
jgi:hypothetical protein